MNNLLDHLLEPLASIEEQRRHVVGATIDEYLLPEEMLNDAWQFCEQAESADLPGELTSEQRDVVGRLKDALERLGHCIELYDRTNIANLIERDKCWCIIRDRAGETLSVFRSTASV